MKEITYGWVDVNGNKHIDVDETYATLYRLQAPEYLLISKCGVCWDQVELDRYYFSLSNYEFKTYIIVYFKDDTYPSHTFLIYQDNNYYYWFEHSWNKYKGIHKYKTKEELLLDVKNKFINENNYVSKGASFYIYSYKKPPYHIKCMDFYNYITREKKIDL